LAFKGIIADIDVQQATIVDGIPSFMTKTRVCWIINVSTGTIVFATALTKSKTTIHSYIITIKELFSTFIAVKKCGNND